MLKSLPITPTEILHDYRIACESRAASLLARKEVFAGKAKFGIFGDGKEVTQLAMAKYFQAGDWRSGYYRDQTFMFSIGALTLQQYFAQLYAHASIEADPASGGRMMNSHFATRFIDTEGNWLNQLTSKNVSADLSCTASQMPRLLGLAYASKLYRTTAFQEIQKNFSNKGNEVAFGTIGDASTSEGMFFETINAGGVLQVPMCISIWDDGYGISVPKKYHTTKGDISTVLAGFKRTKQQPGYEIFIAKGWDYLGLCNTYYQAVTICRTEHIPVLIHVKELTQPQGHSTSGSHERYKSTKRLRWEEAYDCLPKMAAWMVENGVATQEMLKKIALEADKKVKIAQQTAWNRLIEENNQEKKTLLALLNDIVLPKEAADHNELPAIIHELVTLPYPRHLDVTQAATKALYVLREVPYVHKKGILAWWHKNTRSNEKRFSSHLYSSSRSAALCVKGNPPIYAENPTQVDGREILCSCFKSLLERDGRVFAIGQDLGIGDVNQGFAGLQTLYGELRVTDTSIRECTMIGQGIGAAMRGLRPIVEIQYLDYLPYALQIIQDDLATLHYRTKGGQKAPMIIRTRGHRLEGIWHAGSYMASIMHVIRGIYLLVPRNMTQAAGFYNTMMQSDDIALIIECLNGYRLKEPMPSNVATMTIPIGVPALLRVGKHVTIVTYGAMCRIICEAADRLSSLGIECEVMDVQTLLPFDIHHSIVKSLAKTNHIVFADEDVPGGTTAYMMQQVLEAQHGYALLEAAPITISSKPHRPAYGDDGNYFSKPNVEEVVGKIYMMMHQVDPLRHPAIF
ncbi:alpha-ketoacid dehydrogenase subunit alpha/beta [Cardinium endosymbiont of Oedothorax gibbosus]|uniref:alpha-ketoacid dehydrogenase subunit alpha/beta n=1 Tax=Cardinium endosymbiont of Oedothorax gibbosus TaxID=931101 RepID=UPI00202494E2|nr:thiamine pyrophosphate-dependent enzyme [Cardinium endosymbiont of Oedothorax gibbosus]CAH2560166.1 Putative Fused Pyruvate dehydrogenase E1 component subunit alpha/beta [Cardinium endosymbiont of Oedothorax gibbosus]